MPEHDTTIDTTASLLPDFSSPRALRHRQWRHIKDVTTRYLMAFGGISVIIAIVLIAFYLLYVVLPMFYPARLEQIAIFPVPGNPASPTVNYAMEEQHEIGLRIDRSGEVVFFNTTSGKPVLRKELLTSGMPEMTAFSAGDPSQHILALGMANGSVLLTEHEYQVTYPNDVRLITPGLSFPYGEEPVVVSDTGSPVIMLSVQAGKEEATIAASTGDNKLWLVNLAKEVSFLDESTTITRTISEIPVSGQISHIVLDIEQRELYVAGKDGTISYYDVSNKKTPRLIQRVNVVPQDIQITSLEFLSGGISILVGDTRGRITQWFPVRDSDNNYTLEQVRFFQSQSAPITEIAPEFFRKGFLAIDEAGYLGIYHTTAHRAVKLEKLATSLNHLAVAPRANAALIQDGSNQLQFWLVHNEHPEISWQSIWGKVWYESREHPEYIWQSSSASSDFEPKFSLTPLAYGTLKAAFYAMLFAIPLAICGAIYTAYFMTSRMRSMVKPTIEIMAALPTVILGFIAGLWFAPFVEKFLPGMILIFILIPIAILITARLWHYLPAGLRIIIPDGWEAALLIPVIIITVACAIWLSKPLELIFFAGNMPLWLNHEWGISYDQRNSLVVGIAIGFAVIPTIFSISEDAIFGVPKHLTTGSLALGATPWQTMVRVVLLTASPGIFSAIMIGLGRAVGETMIVVMATGNTAIMDMNIFQGFRALSANIAVEMPESEVGSTHYRILFLAGLVLFLATFVFNTAAEIIRQRLRTRYSTL